MLGAGVVFILTRNPLLLMAAAIIGVISPSDNEIGSFLSVEQAGLAQLLPDQRRTHVFAWYNLSGSLATATGAICGGWLAPFDSYRAVLVGYAMGGLVLAILFLFLTAVIEVPVESSIPPFRGPGGLWNKYDPRMLELDYFLAHPDRSWPVFREIFYEHFDRARPNKAHEVLAAWEARGAGPDGRGGLLKVLITQNIDNRHREEGIQWSRIRLRLYGCQNSLQSVLNSKGETE